MAITEAASDQLGVHQAKLIEEHIKVIPEAKELDANRGRIDIVVYNHGLYTIKLGANMDKCHTALSIMPSSD